MPDSRIDLKNPWLAGLLAFLIPGAGHFYQGRMFKGVIYSVCILGTFAFGMFLGSGQVVHFRWDARHRTWGYLAQFWVGLPALPALVQWQRTDPLDDSVTQLDEPISAPFSGSLLDDGAPRGELRGHIELMPGEFGTRGIFRGTLDKAAGEAEPIELGLGGRFEIERAILGGPDRRLRIEVAEVLSGGIGRKDAIDDDSIEGGVPRSFWNAFEAPPGDWQLEMLHRRLGKFYELAAVFTWIAGLLNILAIWDAIEGPGYGYGDETEAAESRAGDKQDSASPPPAAEREPATAAGVGAASEPGG